MKKIFTLSLLAIIGLLSPLTGSSASTSDPLQYYDTDVDIYYNAVTDTYNYKIAFDYTPIGYSDSVLIDYMAFKIPYHNDIVISPNIGQGVQVLFETHVDSSEVPLYTETTIEEGYYYLNRFIFTNEDLNNYKTVGVPNGFSSQGVNEPVDRIVVSITTTYTSYSSALQSDLYDLLDNNFKAQEGQINGLTQSVLNEMLEDKYTQGYNDGLSSNYTPPNESEGAFDWIKSLFGAFDVLFGFQFVGGLSVGVILAILIIPKVVLKFFGIATGKG